MRHFNSVRRACSVEELNREDFPATLDCGMSKTRRCDSGVDAEGVLAGMFPCCRVRWVMNLPRLPGCFVSGCLR